ncbi:conserved hypothetical protein [Tenacibaculum litopenaei]|uniref:DUF3352 domain-containing protein n=1 Tax=Tenacibaculum litopenaei TaxID=396016 RepID=UPI003894AF71
MKKKLFIGIGILVALFLGYQAYIFTIAPSDNINPLYLIPDDAVFVIDTERPIDTWDEISVSPIWKQLSSNPSLKEVTENLSNLDKTFKSQEDIIKLIGERDLLISVHVYKPQSYGLFYTVDLQKFSKLSFLRSAIGQLAGDNFKVTNRVYKEHDITELYNKATRETLYLSFIKNQLIASFTHVLVEKSIDQYQSPTIGRDLNFTEIYKETPNDGFFKLFVQYKYLPKYLACFTKKLPASTLQTIEKSWLFSGFSVGLKEGAILQAEGFTNLDLTTESYLRALQKSGTGKRSIAKIAPRNTALYLSFAFESFDEFLENFEAIKEEDPESFTSYNEQVKAIEDRLEINLKEQVFSWVGNEVALLHINDGISKKNTDMAVVLHTKDIVAAKKQMQFIVDKIAENTPLKFKKINYKGYPINFLDLKGFFKLFAADLFSKMEKPYFTFIDDCVVFSNSPNTLKEMVNTQLMGYTLATYERFRDFNDQFDEETSLFAYINTPYAYEDLIGYADRKTRRSIAKNKNDVISFSQIGLQLVSKGSYFENYLTASFEAPAEVNSQLAIDKAQKKQLRTQLDTQADSTQIIVAEQKFILPEIFPNDLSAREFIKKYDDGSTHIEVELKNGLKHGDYKEYYRNGHLKLSGKFKNGELSGTWKAYSKEDEDLLFKKRF